MPGQPCVQLTSQAQSQVDGLHSVFPVHEPPQSVGHWQEQLFWSHSKLVPAHAPPQLVSQSQAHVVGLQTVPGPQAPPQSGGHSQVQEV